MRALVVDDNEDLRFLIGRLLRLDGFEVVEASDGDQAIGVLVQEPPFDVVILDVQMPVADGWQALRAIRRQREWDSVRVVMCTVKGRPDDLVQGWELGCDGFVTKPFDIDAFRQVVREVVQRGDEDRAAQRRAEIRLARANASG